MNNEVRNDLKRLCDTLDSLLDELYDSQGTYDDDADALLDEIREKYNL